MFLIFGHALLFNRIIESIIPMHKKGILVRPYFPAMDPIPITIPKQNKEIVRANC